MSDFDGAAGPAGQPPAKAAGGLFEFVLLAPIDYRNRNHFARGRHVFVSAHQRWLLRHLGVIGDTPVPEEPTPAAWPPKRPRKPRVRAVAAATTDQTGAVPEAPTSASDAGDGPAPDPLPTSCPCAGPGSTPDAS